MSQAATDATMATPSVEVAIAIGELVDKITILEIKSERLSSEAALSNVRHELAILSDVLARQALAADVSSLVGQLKTTNAEIWDLEDAIRACESAQDFGPTFVDVARRIYRTNDRRAAVKRAINEASGSTIIEEKSYAAY